MWGTVFRHRSYPFDDRDKNEITIGDVQRTDMLAAGYIREQYECQQDIKINSKFPLYLSQMISICTNEQFKVTEDAQLIISDLDINAKQICSILKAINLFFQEIDQFQIDASLTNADVISVMKCVSNLSFANNIKSVRFGFVGVCSELNQLISERTNNMDLIGHAFPQLIEFAADTKPEICKDLIRFVNNYIAGPNLQVLHFGMCVGNDWTPEITTLVSLSNLRSLSTWYCQFDHSALKELNFEELVCLNTTDNDIFGLHNENGLRRFQECKKLKHWEMDGGVEFRDLSLDTRTFVQNVVHSVVQHVKSNNPKAKIRIFSRDL